MTSIQELKAVVSSIETQLLAEADVQSVGIGADDDGNPTIIVGVVSESSLSSEVQSHIETIIPMDTKYELREVGEFSAELLKAQSDFQSKHRPVIHGVSCGHPDITAGTTGFLYSTSDENWYLGSNNHVLALTNAAEVGDSSLQPAPADGGTTEDEFGALAYYKNIQDGVNVDLALARVSVGTENRVMGIDQKVVGVAGQVAVDDELLKAGRTTGVTRGTVDQIGASVNVNYGDAGTFTISDCIITGDMSDGGDSGSAVWKEGSDGLYAAGRLFAGSSSATVHHSFANELATLQQEFDTSINLITDEPDSGPTGPTANVNLMLAPTSPDSGNLVVTCVDDTGAAIEGATVSISGETSDSMSTDANGVAAFEGVPLGSYSVEAVKSGYESATGSVSGSDFS